MDGAAGNEAARGAGIPSLWLVAGLLVLHQLLLTGIHYGLGPALGIDPRAPWLIVVTITGAAAVIVAVVALDLRTRGRRQAVMLERPRWNGRTAGTMLLGAVIAQLPLLYLAVRGLTVWQAGGSSHLEVGEALKASMTTAGGLALLLATVIVAPLIEELLYRGYLLGALVRRMPAALAVAISALLFVTLHAEAANLVAALCLGVGTGICAVRTRSIVPGLVVHIASNAFGMWYSTLA